MARTKKDNRWKDIDGGAAFIIPISLLRHPNFKRLSCYGNKLIMDLARQYSGFNNGYLCGSFSLMKEEGWNAPMTLHKAATECEHYRLIQRTQQGSLNKPNLYALTWRRIDEKKGRDLDIRPTMAPSNAWKEDRPDFVFEPKKRSQSSRTRKLKRAA